MRWSPFGIGLDPRRIRRMQGTLAVTGNAAADDLLNTDPLAALIGMLLDQQVR